MNFWTERSSQLANQENYLDLLFKVYPTTPDSMREIDPNKWKFVKDAFEAKDNIALISALLKLDLFPIKDSYIAYLRHDENALIRNPNTVNRIAGAIYEMGIDKVFEKCSTPKEANRQIGPLFKRWIKSGVLGLQLSNKKDFISTNENAILDASDSEMMSFAKDELGYNHNKGLDFLARFNGKYVIGEAKFLTDFGEHQNAQFADAISTITTECNAIRIAILDGVLYIPNTGKFQKHLKANENQIIISSLLLRDFLYTL